jgi:hypothetical protein
MAGWAAKPRRTNRCTRTGGMIRFWEFERTSCRRAGELAVRPSETGEGQAEGAVQRSSLIPRQWPRYTRAGSSPHPGL